MEFVHEAIIERRKILEAIWAGFFQSLEKEDLASRIQLLKELAELGHTITPGRNTQNVMNKPLDKLLLDIFARKIAFWELSSCKKLFEWNGLSSKWD